MRRQSVFLWLGVVCAAAGILSSVTAASAADWPGWRGPARDGKSADTGLLKQWPEGGPKLLWKATDIGNGFSTVAVSKGVVYTAGHVGGDFTIFTFDLNGKPKWKAVQGPAVKTSHPGSRSTPVISDGKLYLVGAGGLVACHSITDGKQVWKKELKSLGGRPHKWGYAESALILDNMAIVTPGGKNAMVALNKATGSVIWKSDVQARAHYSSAIVVKEGTSTIIVQGSGDGIFAVNAKDGKKIWMNEFCKKNTANCPDPAYADGHLFWANGYGKGGICFKVECKGGKWSFSEAYRTKDMVCHHGGYVIDKGCVYGNNGGGWACLDLKTGQVKWKDKGVGKGSLCFADGMLYLFGEKGGKAGLAAAAPDGFKMTGRFSVAGKGPSWAHPVVADGKLFLRYDTNLYCFDVKK
jgi:outer membrane protein assembly factor BamB